MLIDVEAKQTNYVFVPQNTPLTKARKEKRTGRKCYIINSNDHLFYADTDFNMTIERAKVFLLSKLGEVAQDVSSFEKACDICLGCHEVYWDEHSCRWICDCKSFCHDTECSHEKVVEHIEKRIDLYTIRSSYVPIPTGRAKKRRLNELIKIPFPLDNEIKAAGLWGLEVAKAVGGSNSFGKIKG